MNNPMKKSVLSKGDWGESGSYEGTSLDGDRIFIGYVIEIAQPGQVGWTVEVEYWGRQYLGTYTKLRSETKECYTLTEARAIAKYSAVEFYNENN